MFDAPRWDNDPRSPKHRPGKGKRNGKQSLRWFGRRLQRQFDRVDAAKFEDTTELGIVIALINHVAAVFNTSETMLEEMREGGDEG